MLQGFRSHDRPAAPCSHTPSTAVPDVPDSPAHASQAIAADAFTQHYDALHAQARRLMRRERDDHTWTPTVLVHELFLRLRHSDLSNCGEREAFLRYARTAMVNLLIDHARSSDSQRRGGAWTAVSLEAITDLADESSEQRDVLLEQAVQTLASVNVRAFQVLTLRCIVGLDVEQTAEALAISPRTVCRDWDVARGLLHCLLKDAPASNPAALAA